MQMQEIDENSFHEVLRKTKVLYCPMPKLPSTVGIGEKVIVF